MEEPAKPTRNHPSPPVLLTGRSFAPQNRLWLQSEQKEKVESCSSSLGNFRLSGAGGATSALGELWGPGGKKGQS